MARRRDDSQLVHQRTDNLTGGVSRQSSRTRAPNQLDECDNFAIDVTRGLTSRPPAEFIDTLPTLPANAAGGVKVHPVSTGEDGDFILTVEDSLVRAFKLDGTEVPIVDEGGSPILSMAYLVNPDLTVHARDQYRLVSTAEFTYIVNRSVEVAMTATLSPARANAVEFLHYQKTAPSAGEVALEVFNVPKVATPDFRYNVAVSTQTDATAGKLMDKFRGSVTAADMPTGTQYLNTGPNNDWGCEKTGNNYWTAWLMGSPTPPSGYEIRLTDDEGDASFTFLYTGPDGETPQTSKFSNLPVDAPDGFLVKIQGKDGTPEGAYYVKYSSEANAWVETCESQIEIELDATTMPHALRYDAANSRFVYQTLPWKTRDAGDDETAPLPAFVGNKINALTVHQNRLVLASGEVLNMSEAGEFYNFFPTTMLTIPESDPIEVVGTASTTAFWDHLVNTGRNVVALSSSGNLASILTGSGDKNLAVETARLEVLGRYPISPTASAFAARGDLIFPEIQTGQTAFHRLTERDVLLWVEDEFSAVAGDYIPGDPGYIEWLDAEQTMVVGRQGGEPELLWYKQYFSGQEQLLSAWGKWQFDEDEILGVAPFGSELFLVTRRGAEYVLLRLDFTNEADPSLDFRIHLDRRTEVQGTYDLARGTTRFVLPYSTSGQSVNYAVVLGGAWGDRQAERLDHTVLAATIFDVAGDVSAHPVYIGRPYSRSFRMGEIHVVDDEGTSGRATGRITGRLQLRRGHFAHADTAFYRVRVSSDFPADTDVYEYEFNSLAVGSSYVGLFELDTDEFEFDIGGDSSNVRITVQSDSFLPVTLQGFEWEGRFFSRV